MRNRGLWMAAAMFLHAAVFAQARLDAVVETKRFHEPGRGDMVHVNIAVLGNTALWTMDERGFERAQVEVLTMIEQNGQIIDFRKEKVTSPERADTLQGDFTYQANFLLAPGEYAIVVEMHDANLADTARTYVNMPLVVADRGRGVSLSDIMFTLPAQAGKGPMPFMGTYFPPEIDRLGAYVEAYGTIGKFGAGGPFLAVTQIEDYETGNIAGNFRHVQRMKADTVAPALVEFGIGRLPSGNYLLAVELRDRNDSLVQRRTQFFQRNNPMTYDPGNFIGGEQGPNFTDAFTNADTLAEHLRSLRPIADELERKMIDDQAKDGKLDLMRHLMYSFWYNRDPADPKAAWERYLQAVHYADQRFGCRNMRGYQSDQGYVFLRYGAPNTVVDRRNETTVLPYMIWHYYRAGKYSDRRFVFYQPERSTTCWTLLTSDVPGELNNTRWLDTLVPGMADGGVKRDEVLNNFKNPR
ncbi:MAG TPA: GWxTD domain-containing protein [Flavobacteriales bacterium]|nr:GWxTD domain-containing protein [Flavobacteriales bacterium]